MRLPEAVTAASNLLDDFVVPPKVARARATIEPQCGRWWCWAAVLQAILARRGKKLRQCQIVDQHFEVTGTLGRDPDCCPRQGECKGTADDPCDQPADLGLVLANLGIAAASPAYCKSIGIKKLVNQLKVHPVPCSFAGGMDPHYCLIDSSTKTASGYRIVLLDPSLGTRTTFSINSPCFVHPEGNRASEQLYFLK